MDSRGFILTLENYLAIHRKEKKTQIFINKIHVFTTTTKKIRDTVTKKTIYSPSKPLDRRARHHESNASSGSKFRLQ